MQAGLQTECDAIVLEWVHKTRKQDRNNGGGQAGGRQEAGRQAGHLLAGGGRMAGRTGLVC